MEIPPSLIQASIPSTFSAPTLTSRVLHSTNASTVTSIATQTVPLYVSTLLGSTIQTNTVYGSTITSNNIWIDTLLASSIIGSTIQTDTSLVSSLTGSTLRTNTIYVSSAIGLTVQTNTCNTPIISGSTIQSNTLITSTIIGDNIQSNTLITSTLTTSTIQSNIIKVSTLLGSTIQSNTIKVSTIVGSTIQNNQLNTNITTASTLYANIFQPSTLQVSTLSGSTIQTTIANISILQLAGSTFQTNKFNFNTITGSTIQAHTVNVSTLLGSILIGCTIQVNAIKCSTISGSTIQATQLNVSTLIGSSSQTKQGVVSVIQCSTLIGSTVQTDQINGSTITASSIQNKIIQMSSLIADTIQISTLSISSLIGSTIQTSTLQVSTLSGSTIQTNTLQVSTLLGSTIQAIQLNISTFVCSTLETNQLDGSTILYSTIKTNALSASTIRSSTIIGSNIQIDTLQVSSISGSTMIGSFFSTNKILTTDGSKMIVTSDSDASYLQYITNLTSQAAGQGQANTWSAAQTFSTVDIYYNSLIAETPSYILGINASNQMVKYLPEFSMNGTLASNYIPYASGISTLNNSIIYRVNDTDIAIGQTTSTFPKSLTASDFIQVYGEYITFDLGVGGNYHNTFYNGPAGWTTPYKIQFVVSDDNISWSSLGIITSSTGGFGNYIYTLSNKRYLRMVIIEIYNANDGGDRSMLIFSPSISQDGGTNLFTNTNQISLSPNLTQGNWWDVAGFKTINTQYTGAGTENTVGTYTGTNYTTILPANASLNPYTLTVAGNTQATSVITETGTLSKIVMPDKRWGVNGLQIPGSNGCNFYMGTMNNNYSGNYTDTLYLNSIPSIDITDSFNVRNNIVVTSSGTGFETMPSFTPSSTALTFSALFICTGSTMPSTWARVFDIGNTTGTGTTRGFLIAFHNSNVLWVDYRQADGTITSMSTSIQLKLNTMYHVVWTISSSGSHVLYINGQQAATMTKVITFDTLPYFYLGKSNWADPYPNMTLFDFRMMNRSLTVYDVMGLYYSLKKISGITIPSGQYIELNRPNGEYLNLAEIQVFSYEGGPNIITPSTSVSFPDARSDLPASNFVDGNLSNFMHSSGTTNSTVIVNLGSTRPIYKIIIYNRLDCCFNRANGIVLTIKNSSNTVIYTSSPIPDKLGRTTVQTDTGNTTDYYYTFTYFPPYAAVIGDLENTEPSTCKINTVMFNKGTPGMRIYQGLNQARANYTSYKDLVTTEIGPGSDTISITFGPNVMWSSYLKIGSGPNRVGTNTAQVISTNGNLHLDCGSNGRALYLNAYTNDAGTGVIYSYTPWTHTGSLTTTENIYVRWGINTPNINNILSSNGMYWNSYGRGFVTAEQASCLYGSFSTYGSARNGWAGWGCGSKVTLMTDGTTVLFHDNSYGWVIWGPSQNDPWSNRRLLLGGGSVQCSQWWDRFMVFVNAYDTGSGYFYVNRGGGFGGPSDERIKKNIKPIDTEQSIAFIRGIVPSYYCLKNTPIPQLDANGKETGEVYGVDDCEQSGFIAQNVLASARNAGLPESTVSNVYDYEQELSLPEKERKTLLGLSDTPLISHSYNALKGIMKKQDSQQIQINEINSKCSMLDINLTTLQDTVRQNAELLQQLMAKSQ